jgi:hypothetical protein
MKSFKSVKSCKNYLLEIHQLLEEQASLDAFPLLQQHLQHCLSCQQNYQELKKLFHSCENIHFPEPSPDLAFRILNALPSQPPLLLKNSASSVSKSLYFSLIFALILFSFLLFYSSFPSSPQNPPLSPSSTQEEEPRLLPLSSPPLPLLEKDQEREMQQWLSALQWPDSSAVATPFSFLPLFQTLPNRFRENLENLENFEAFLPEFRPVSTFLNPPQTQEKVVLFETVTRDFSHLFQEVRRDLSFVSLGL